MPKFCRHWISNRLHRCKRTRPETSTFIGIGSCTHVTALWAPHCCVMRQEMEPIQSKCVNRRATWHTGLFRGRDTSILPVWHSASQYTIRRLLRAWGSNMSTGRMYQNPCFAATQQASITSTIHRYLFSLILKYNSLAGSGLREATTVKRRLQQARAAMLRGNGDIICQVDTDWRNSWFSNITAATKNIRFYIGRTLIYGLQKNCF